MKKIKQLRELKKPDLLNFFHEVDLDLKQKNQKIKITVLGGAALVLLELKERATYDIDIAPEQEGESYFIKEGLKRGILIQPVTVSTTIDFIHCEKRKVYQGSALTIQSISPEELIKSKLERFQKQDPDDIYTIIQKINFSYESFKALVKEMMVYFIGSPLRLLMHSRTVVEQMYPENSEEFKREIKE